MLVRVRRASERRIVLRGLHSGKSRRMVSEVRKAENEVLFRDANEGLRDVQRSLDLPPHELPFLCECDDQSCHEIVRLAAEEYEHVRSNPRAFLLAPGHEAGAVAVADGRFDVIEKTGVQGEIAERSDPRQQRV